MYCVSASSSAPRAASCAACASASCASVERICASCVATSDKRGHERLVVRGDGVVEIGVAALQLRAQSHRHRKSADGSPDPTDAVRLAAVRKRPKPNASRPIDGAQIDVGIELGLGFLHFVRDRIDAPARRDDVRAAAHEIGRQVVGQAHFVAYAERRPRDRQAAVRSGAEQGGQLVARREDAAVERRERRAARREIRLRGLALDFVSRPVAMRPAVMRSICSRCVDFLLRDVAQRIEPRKLVVGARDGRRRA